MKNARIAAAATLLATPPGGWPETRQAYRRLLDACYSRAATAAARNAARARQAEAAIEAARAAGCTVHPDRR